MDVMNKYLYRYDIYPKVFLINRDTEITVRAIDSAFFLGADKTYTVKLSKLDQANEKVYPEREGRYTLSATTDSQGALKIHFNSPTEGQYKLYVFEPDAEKPVLELFIYALAEDMKGRFPYRGDLHVHSKRSDGSESPEKVCANYRAAGYDFMTVSDHGRYYPSLEAKEIFDQISDLNIVEGEEVHLSYNNVHYVNFGGSYSINALITPNNNQEKAGDDIKYRSINLSAPETMTKEEFKEMIDERANKVNRPHLSERRSYAVMEWIYEHIKRSNGLGIFPHPFWLCPMQQLSDDYLDFIYEKKPFDAFEVLGGETYYQHNGFQTAYYYKKKAEGFDPPIVGSTDTHGSTPMNRGMLICSTIVFAGENKKDALIEAIKEKYSIAVDTISQEYRLVGDYRFVKYASFLMENYYPIHDKACACEGYYMNEYLTSPEAASPILKAMKGQIKSMQEKYFAL